MTAISDSWETCSVERTKKICNFENLEKLCFEHLCECGSMCVMCVFVCKCEWVSVTVNVNMCVTV